MEYPDYFEEKLTEEKFCPRLNDGEVITDDIPTQEYLSPFPVKLVEVSTGKEVEFVSTMGHHWHSVKNNSSISTLSTETSQTEVKKLKLNIKTLQNNRENLRIANLKVKDDISSGELVQTCSSLAMDKSNKNGKPRAPPEKRFQATSELMTFKRAEIEKEYRSLQRNKEVERSTRENINHMTSDAFEEPIHIVVPVNLVYDDETDSSVKYGAEETSITNDGNNEKIRDEDIIKYENDLNHIGNVNSNENIYKCESCDIVFSQKEHLQKHILVHRDEMIFRCSFCDKLCNNKESFATHVSTHRVGKAFMCSWCNKCFYPLSKLKQHLRIHTKEKPFNCNVCKKRFSHKGHLKVHERIHTKDKPFRCNFCESCFSRKSHLVEHKRIHTEEKEFKCNFCEKSFCDKSHLRTHERIHTKEKPFQCSVCEKCFSVKSNLRIHERIHTKEKMFRCSFCEKRFSAKGNLRTHERVHTKERPFKCDWCEKCFSQKSILRTHARTHVKEKQFTAY